MKPLDFEYLQTLLKERSGLVLSADKVYLVESRLMPVARARSMNGLDELISEVRNARDDKLLVEITDAMTTNESFFFRDIAPFESFRNTVLPKVAAARKEAGKVNVRIWSAACSSGQEPYTLAMILKEDEAKYPGMHFEIVATDLSTEIVAKAKAGLYSQFEVQRGLPVQLLMKYFKQKDEHWEISPEIKSKVSYRLFNLLDSFRSLGTFDIVFIRNVLIYFDQETKSDILNRISGQIPGDGILYLGGAESVLGISKAFKPISGLRGVYGIVPEEASNLRKAAISA